MKLKMDINRWRTAADLTVLEVEPMYAGSMYVHKLIVQANLYETDNSKENLRASFSVNGEAVAQNVPLVKIDPQDSECEVGYAWYEALIPAKLFKVAQSVNINLALCTVVNGEFSQILVTSPIQFTIEGNGALFENQMSEEERRDYDEQLSVVLAELNDMRDTVDSFPDIDSRPTENSTNLVMSGGVHSAIESAYTDGAGLGKNGGVFYIKTNSDYLKADENGLSVEAQDIADLAKVKLNNVSHVSKVAEFYAPTGAGSNGQVLFASGNGAPSWGTFNVNGETAKYKSIFAPTSSRGSNSTNSCWVLVPNGTNSAPVWKELEVVKNGLVYSLKLGGVEFGKIQLTQEVYLDSVSYNSTTNKLVFTYNTASGKSSVNIDLTDLVDVYSAGDGLQKSGNAFSVKIASGSEDYLQSTANGLVFNESALPIPQVTGADAGKFLRINTEGKIIAETIPIAEEMSV